MAWIPPSIFLDLEYSNLRNIFEHLSKNQEVYAPRPNTSLHCDVNIAEKFCEKIEKILIFVKCSIKVSEKFGNETTKANYKWLVYKIFVDQENEILKTWIKDEPGKICNFLDDLSFHYSEIVAVQTIGYSFQNQKIQTIQISDPLHSSSKRAIWIDGGTHGREWVSVTAALYIIDRDDTCSNSYPGLAAFSEPETRAVSNFIRNRVDLLSGYISFHSYGQLWLYPYAYQENTVPPDVDSLTDKCKGHAKSGSARFGAVISASPLCAVVWAPANVAPGGGHDWLKSIGVKYTYTVELRPDSTAFNGFIMSRDELIPTATEAWTGVRIVADQILQDAGFEKVIDDRNL
uniref:Peptidase M14 carboxypeptidase A domain-containing protein n=1 Tax=Romanomermis culicivorax TaxID=13658 RepID=A0A915ITH7_ROMCU